MSSSCRWRQGSCVMPQLLHLHCCSRRWLADRLPPQRLGLALAAHHLRYKEG